MKHLIDYALLQEWGFIWCTIQNIDNEEVCTSYFLKEIQGSSIHNYNSIMLSVVPNDYFQHEWILSIAGDTTQYGGLLFRGCIRNAASLDIILGSCLIFKPLKH